MGKKWLSLAGLFFWLACIIPPASADKIPLPEHQLNVPLYQTPLTDQDGDGIASAVESAGWSNGMGGPYVTDHLNPDSDSDGLSDGQEQLYNTHPLNASSPGMYIIYQDDLQTRQYFGWNQAGTTYFAHAQAANSDVVVRRGSTFVINGPANADLSINKSKSGLTTLTPQPNLCGGGWTVTIPANATVGEYTLVMQTNNWTRRMGLYVIFELPTNLSNSEVDTFVYDDNPADLRDETSIWFDTGEEPPSSAQHLAWGRSYRFATEQFAPYLLNQHVMNVIGGETNQEAAAVALTHYLDGITRFDNTVFSFNMTNALQKGPLPPGQGGAQCSNIANMLTSFNRAAGIASRPFLVDWDREVTGSGKFDHATEVWLDGQWKVLRGYNVLSGGEDPPRPISGGITGPKTQVQWGSNNYIISRSDIILYAGAGYTLAETGDTGSGSKDYEWNNTNPCTIKRHDWVKTAVTIYWPENWPAKTGCAGEPTDTGTPSRPELTSTGVPPTPLTEAGLAHIAGIANEYGFDSNSNGRFDELVVEVRVETSQPGNYILGASLTGNLAKAYAASTSIQDIAQPAALKAGVNTIPLKFSGLAIGEFGAAGPFAITDLWLAPQPAADPAALADQILDYQAVAYRTAPYQPGDFEQFGADLSGRYSHTALDQNSDGLMDKLIITTPLVVLQPGSYRVEAELADSAGQVVATAGWSGTSDTVTLEFEALLADVTPYAIQNVRLYDSNNILIDSDAENYNGFSPAGASPVELPDVSTGPKNEQLFLPLITKSESAAFGTPDTPAAPVQLVDTPASTPYSTGSLYGSVTTGLNLQTASAPVEVAALDPNSDGKIDQLQFTLHTTLAVPGSYLLQGWLQNSEGKLIAWETSAPVGLAAGSQSLSLTFAGDQIKAQGLAGPYQLVALKILFGPNELVIDEVALAAETLPYSPADFAGLVTGNNFGLNALLTCSSFTTSSPDLLGEETSFTSTVTGDNLSYEWNFGDGSPVATGPTATHTYANAGAYIVMLTVNDGVDSHTAMATVVIENPLPVASFSSSSPDSLGQITQFTNLSGGSNVSYEWNFGDGSAASSEVNPSHLYATTGSFTVVLTATNSAGSDTFAQTIQINQSPTTGQPFYLSLSNSGSYTVGGVSGVKDEDILYFDGSAYSMIFDGSDVGVGGLDVDAFEVVNSNTILMSFNNAATVGSLGTVANADIVQFNATSLGSQTAGTFSWYLDGSDVGLDTSAENIDALDRLPDGRLLISTTGNPAVPGVSGKDEDLLALTPASLGANSSGSWAMYFDGSDVGLSTSSTEDVGGVSVGGDGRVYLVTLGAFAVSGVSGTGEDIFICTPSSLGNTTACSFAPTLLFDGSQQGVAGNPVDGVSLPN